MSAWLGLPPRADRLSRQGPKLEAVYANALGYPGLNPDSIQHTDPKIAPYLPTEPTNLQQQFWISDQWWADNGAQAIERWNQWLLKK